MHPLECRTDARIPFPSFFWRRLSLFVYCISLTDVLPVRKRSEGSWFVEVHPTNETTVCLSVCAAAALACLARMIAGTSFSLSLLACKAKKEFCTPRRGHAAQAHGCCILQSRRERENAQTRIYQGCLGAFLRTWSKERRIPVFDSVGMQTGIGVCADHWASACCNRGNRLVEMHTTRRCIIPVCTQCTPKGAHS